MSKCNTSGVMLPGYSSAPAPLGGQNGLQIRPGGGYHKVPGELGEGGEHLPGVSLRAVSR